MDLILKTKTKCYEHIECLIVDSVAAECKDLMSNALFSKNAKRNYIKDIQGVHFSKGVFDKNT